MSGRTSHQHALRALEDELLILASAVDRAIERSVGALWRHDLEAARQVMADTAAIDHQRSALEEQAIRLVVTRQQVARDPRAIVGTLAIIADLERMVDHAQGIARITVLRGDAPLSKPPADLLWMANRARDLLRRRLDAVIVRDAGAARATAGDGDVDALHRQVYCELLGYLFEHPEVLAGAGRRSPGTKPWGHRAGRSGRRPGLLDAPGAAS